MSVAGGTGAIASQLLTVFQKTILGRPILFMQRDRLCLMVALLKRTIEFVFVKSGYVLGVLTPVLGDHMKKRSRAGPGGGCHKHLQRIFVSQSIGLDRL